MKSPIEILGAVFEDTSRSGVKVQNDIWSMRQVAEVTVEMSATGHFAVTPHRTVFDEKKTFFFHSFFRLI
jgi:hypothetical protein